MRQISALLLAIFVTGTATAEVLSVPSADNLVAIKFGSCTDGVYGNYTKPGNTSSTPANDQIGGVLGKYSSDVDCSSDGGTIIGTKALAPLGTVATLERDADTLSSYPIVATKKTGELKKGSTIRIISYGGSYGAGFGMHGDMYIIAEVLDRK